MYFIFLFIFLFLVFFFVLNVHFLLSRFFPGGLVVKKWKYKILVKKGEKCYIPSDLLEGGDFRKILWNAMKGGYEIVDIQ